MPRHFAEDKACFCLVDHYTPVVCERRSKCKVESSRTNANRESGKRVQRIRSADRRNQVMFRIAAETCREFTFAEILILAAMNVESIRLRSDRIRSKACSNADHNILG